MKRPIQSRHKLKAAVVLITIMLLLLLNNFMGRKSFSDLDKSISSIYQDRLMPATYIFQISDHLYQKRLLQHDLSSSQQGGEQIMYHESAIGALIARYEKTYLTEEEKTYWATFKQQLLAYNSLPASEHPRSRQAFNSVVQTLNTLSQLQVGEGTVLQKDAKAIVSSSNVMSQFEMSILIILGIFAIVLISLPDKSLVKPGNYSMN